MKRSRSQISIEFLFSFGIILFIFLILLGFIINRNNEITISAKEISQKDNCILISSLAASALVNGPGTIISTQIDHDANITNMGANSKAIQIENTRCFLAVHTLSMAKLQKGTITLENINNYIELNNE
ncbi:MAG: hypothetical protein KKC54_05525 [Nanoarchaeota archaeon]|nr:hypothetical protein [Nanoarchaeota archaeon]MBU1946404.1 hypothetical protein [Nanoarchaeota archaeon]